MINLCTIQFQIQNIHILPTKYIFVIPVDLRTKITSLYSINCLVSISQKERVYCATPHESSNIIRCNFLLLQTTKPSDILESNFDNLVSRNYAYLACQILCSHHAYSPLVILNCQKKSCISLINCAEF
jgi:hypothetical protein